MDAFFMFPRRLFPFRVRRFMPSSVFTYLLKPLFPKSQLHRA